MKPFRIALVTCAVSIACVTSVSAAESPDLAQLDSRIEVVAGQLDARAELVQRDGARLEAAVDAVERARTKLRVAAGGSDEAQPLGVASVARLATAASDVTLAERDLALAQRHLARLTAGLADSTHLAATTDAQRTLDELTRARERLLAQVDSAALVSAAGTDGTVTREDWARALFGALDVQDCDQNRLAVVTWQAAEGTTAGWNPLATTQPAPGATTFNGAAVRNYPSLHDGLAATIATIEGGLRQHAYDWIVYDLSTCAPAAQTVQAINASNWCRGCAGGQYVTGLLDDVSFDYAGFASVVVSRTTVGPVAEIAAEPDVPVAVYAPG